MAARRRDRLEFASRVSGGRRRWPRPAGSRDRPARPAPMVAPSAPRDARSKIPPGPEGSNGIDRRGRRGQPAGPPPFRALESASALPSARRGDGPNHPASGWHRGARQQRYRSTRAPRPAGGAATFSGRTPALTRCRPGRAVATACVKQRLARFPPARRESAAGRAPLYEQRINVEPGLPGWRQRQKRAAGRAPLYEQRIDVEPGLPGWRQRRGRSGASPASGC